MVDGVVPCQHAVLLSDILRSTDVVHQTFLPALDGLANEKFKGKLTWNRAAGESYLTLK